MNNGCIYSLRDPDTNAVHYIGSTINSKTRLYAHIRLAKRKPGKNKNMIWIRSLLDQGKKPLFVIENEGISFEDLWGKEKDMILLYKSVGAVLYNSSMGRRCIYKNISETFDIEITDNGPKIKSKYTSKERELDRQNLLEGISCRL